MIGRGLATTSKIGSATCALMHSKYIVNIVTKVVSSDPYHFLCPESRNCEDCDEARSFSLN